MSAKSKKTKKNLRKSKKPIEVKKEKISEGTKKNGIFYNILLTTSLLLVLYLVLKSSFWVEFVSGLGF